MKNGNGKNSGPVVEEGEEESGNGQGRANKLIRQIHQKSK